MANERYPLDADAQGDYYNRGDTQDYGLDYGSGRNDGYAGGRDHPSQGQRGGYGARDYGNQRYAQRDQAYGRRGAAQGYGAYGDGGRDRYAPQVEYHGSYASDGRRFEDVGRYRDADDDNRQRGRSYGGQPQGYDYQDRGFLQRAGDEVRSWFGDDDAERRRDEDARRDERYGGRGDYGADRHRDADYHGWRSTQIAALDRDYDEYRRENRSRFESEFASWRTNRQGQRDQLGKVAEHMDVVGSDGEHVGTVDKVRGDRILLTKNDVDAGGRHHSIPSNWLQSVDDKVTLAKTAAEAKRQWQDEERNQAMFGYGDNAGRDRQDRNATDRTTTAKTY